MAVKNINIDIGLEVLCIARQPKQTLSCKDIADVCGCTTAYIFEVEKKALKKIKALFKEKKVDDYI